MGHLDTLSLGDVAGGAHSFLVGVGHDLLQVALIHCVEHVKEVVPRRPLVLGVGIGEVLEELGMLGYVWPQSLDRQLLVVRHVDVRHLGLMEELLLLGEDLLQEVLGQGARLWQVVLDYREVRQKKG